MKNKYLIIECPVCKCASEVSLADTEFSGTQDRQVASIWYKCGCYKKTEGLKKELRDLQERY